MGTKRTMPAKSRSAKSAKSAMGVAKPKVAKARAPAAPRGSAKPARAVVETDPAGLLDTLQKVARSLREVAESLAATQTSFADALFHMPRPSEFEPLAEPLREFARVAPPLGSELAATVRSVAELGGIASRLEALLDRVPALAGPSARASAPAPTLALAPRIDAARRAVSDALASLPRETDYVPVARQLRELASVSPSLLAWLEEIPKLSAPLSTSVANLRAAERLLFETHDELIETGGRDAERRPS